MKKSKSFFGRIRIRIRIRALKRSFNRSAREMQEFYLKHPELSPEWNLS